MAGGVAAPKRRCRSRRDAPLDAGHGSDQNSQVLQSLHLNYFIARSQLIHTREALRLAPSDRLRSFSFEEAHAGELQGQAKVVSGLDFFFYAERLIEWLKRWDPGRARNGKPAPPLRRATLVIPPPTTRSLPVTPHHSQTKPCRGTTAVDPPPRAAPVRPRRSRVAPNGIEKITDWRGLDRQAPGDVERLRLSTVADRATEEASRAVAVVRFSSPVLGRRAL